MTEPGTFMWNELLTDRQHVAGSFYTALFGWDLREVDAGPLGTYTIFSQKGKDVAGMMNPTASDYGGSPPPKWIAYIAVDDCKAIAARASELGAVVLEQPVDIPDVGTICLLKDPVGAHIYVMQPL